MHLRAQALVHNFSIMPFVLHTLSCALASTSPCQRQVEQIQLAISGPSHLPLSSLRVISDISYGLLVTLCYVDGPSDCFATLMAPVTHCLFFIFICFRYLGSVVCNLRVAIAEVHDIVGRDEACIHNKCIHN